MAKSLYNAADPVALETAFVFIDRLNALGVHQQEISKLIQQQDSSAQIKSGEEYKKNPFPLVAERIRQEEARLGITPAETEQLVEAHRLERDIASLRAKQIAQEEIKKAYLKLQIATN